MGTQDNLDEAKDFVDRHEIESVEMYWDDSFDSWEPFEITRQPAAVLLDDDGSVVERWQGQLDPDEVLDAIDG